MKQALHANHIINFVTQKDGGGGGEGLNSIVMGKGVKMELCHILNYFAWVILIYDGDSVFSVTTVIVVVQQLYACEQAYKGPEVPLY